MVTTWSLTKDGLTISYVREDHNPKALHLILTSDETLKELSIVGSLEDFILQGNNKDWPSKAFMNDQWYAFPQFAELYKMCQWEALAIAIRHEEEKELANDMNMLELDAAINALK